MVDTDNMTEKIIIQKNKHYIDKSTGINKKSWVEYFKCWAEFKTVGWRNYFSSKAAQAENTVTFIIYYSSKTKELLNANNPMKDYRILYKNRTYDIKYIEDIGNRHEFIEIKAEVIL